MSMAIVHHVWQKSQAKGSARTVLLTLAIHANECCGVAWVSDGTLRHEVNVSHQRIHELKNVLEAAGELVIVERPGYTNLYFVAWQGQPLGLHGEASDGQGRAHQPGCPLRRGGQESLTPRSPEGVSEHSDPQGSEISKRGGQKSLIQQVLKTREKKETGALAPEERLAVARRCGWGSCTRPVCPHEVNFCAGHADCPHCPLPPA